MWVLMQANETRSIIGLKVAADGVGNHGVEFDQRFSLGGDSAALWRVPSRDEAAGFTARLNSEGDLVHGSKLA